MTDREAALLWLSSFVKNKEPMTLIPKQLIRLMYNALRECETKTGQWENGHCTCCGEDIVSHIDTWTDVQSFAYCPKCGANMSERGVAKVQEPDCRICSQCTCRYYHELRKPTECKSYVRSDWAPKT